MIVDLGSHNGTFVNGQRVGSAPVTERDIIGIGPATFRLVGEELQEFLDTGDISFIAKDLTVTLPSGRVLLDHVSFPLGERCLMGVIGPSGAGKSTLLGALTGIAPANHGTVLYDNRDLYMNYAELRHRIGLVPQENILHTQLTARRALGYAAELRFPRDTSKAERMHRIDEVLDELALTKHAETKTAAMSGGQQKRVNVALELLTKPSLLFLDEPTSGLDPGLDKSVMEQMRDLAHDGRTVIVVTHSVANLNLCDRLLVLVPGGKIAYFGAPQDGPEALQPAGLGRGVPGVRDRAEPRLGGRVPQLAVLPAVHRGRHGGRGRHPAAGRRGRRRRPRPRPATGSRRCPRWSAGTWRCSPPTAASWPCWSASSSAWARWSGCSRCPGGFTRGPNQQRRAIGLAHPDTGRLLRRRAELGQRDRQGTADLRPRTGDRPVRRRLPDVQADRARRDQRVPGRPARRHRPGRQDVPAEGVGAPDPDRGDRVAMALVGVVSMAIGLLVSSAVSTAERAMPLVFLLVMVQVVTTGGIFAIHGKAGIEEIAWFTPSRWGFAANASTVDLNMIGGRKGTTTTRSGTTPRTPGSSTWGRWSPCSLLLGHHLVAAAQARPAQARRLADDLERAATAGAPLRSSNSGAPPLFAGSGASGGS